MKIPRAYYYMSLFEPLRSSLKLLTGAHKRNGRVQEFEKEYVSTFGNKNISFVSHARTGLYYCLKSLNLPKGSEVLMTPINIPDMVNMIRICELKERFSDIRLDDYSIDLEDAKSKLTENTKVLFVTHLNGIVPDMEKIIAFCRENSLILLQDCTQNIGAKFKGRNLESFSDLSFSALCDLKVIHTHIGGVINSTSIEVKNKIDEIISKESCVLSISYFSRFLVEDMIAVIILNKYIFSLFISPVLNIFERLIGAEGVENFTKGKGLKIGPLYLLKGLFGGGGNVLKREIPKGMLYRYSNLQADIGLRRLKSYKILDEKRILNSHTMYENLNCTGNQLALLREDAEHVFWKLPFRTDLIIPLQKYLSENGVDSAKSNLKCLNEIREFQSKDVTPVAHFLSMNTLYIPAHPYLSKREILKISVLINEFFRKNSLARE